MHASGDTSALPRNSTLCRLGLEAANASVRFEDLGSIDHIPSGEEGIGRAARILSQMDSR